MSNINVNTITPLAGTSGTVSVSGSLLVSGNITAQGNLTFGNQDTDSVAFGAEISSSITPDANNTYNLGSPAKQWKAIYAETASFNQIISSGSTMLILTSASISYLSGSSPITVASTMQPDITNTHSLGTPALQFKDLWVDGDANIDTLTNVSGAVAGYRVSVSASLVPSHNTTWDLGLTGNEWKDLYIDGKAFVDTIANQTNDVLVSASLTPNANASYTFGSTAKQWKHIAGVSASFSHKIGVGSTVNPAEAITVVGNISASGHISASNVGAANQMTSLTASFGTTPSITTNTAGNVIYAHGNISASGATMAATASFGAPTTVTTNLAGTPLYVHGNASASGLVSAQSMSIANGSTPAGVQLSILGNASASGFMSASNIGASSVIGNSVTASTNISTSLATSLATFSSASVTYKLAVGSANHNAPQALTVVGNISASGWVSASNVGAAIGTFTNSTITTLTTTNITASGVISASSTASAIGLGVNTGIANVAPGTISGSGYNLTSQQITGLSGSFTGLGVNTGIANVTTGTISGSGYNITPTIATFAGILNTNVVEQSGTGAEDLTATAKNLVWYANTAQAAAITLPQATAANAGMTIKIIVGTTDWSSTAFKLGFANGGSTVLTGYIRLGSNAGSEAVDGFVVTANAKSLEIDSDDPTAAGGAIGSTYLFTYLEANLVHVEANGQVTTGTPALDAAASTTTGTS